MRFHISLALLITASTGMFCSSAVVAQEQVPYYGPYYGGPAHAIGAGYGVHHHASTAAEGAARGVADVIRASGEANLHHSLAARNYEEAHSRYLDNRIKKVDTFWTVRSVYDRNKALKDAQRHERTSRKLAKSRLEPMAPHEFDDASGRIAWPSLLTAEEFAPHRLRVEALLETRAVYGTLPVHDYAELRGLVLDWRKQIMREQSSYPRESMLASLRFLVRLDHHLKQTES